LSAAAKQQPHLKIMLLQYKINVAAAAELLEGENPTTIPKSELNIKKSQNLPPTCAAATKKICHSKQLYLYCGFFICRLTLKNQ
jgi:hypothetical protein